MIRTIKVNNFNKGFYMSWFVTAQAYFTSTTTLKDDKKTYFKAEKKTRSTNINPPLAINASFIEGNNLELSIDIPESSEIKGSPFSNNILGPNGEEVGVSWIFCAEDASDEDYNDVYVALCCWKHKG